MTYFSKCAVCLILLVPTTSCGPPIPSEIWPDPSGQSPCDVISDDQRANELIASVPKGEERETDKYFHYVAYDCGERYDLVRHELRPDIDYEIWDGGTWYYIDRKKGEIAFTFLEG